MSWKRAVRKFVIGCDKVAVVQSDVCKVQNLQYAMPSSKSNAEKQENFWESWATLTGRCLDWELEVRERASVDCTCFVGIASIVYVL